MNERPTSQCSGYIVALQPYDTTRHIDITQRKLIDAGVAYKLIVVAPIKYSARLFAMLLLQAGLTGKSTMNKLALIPLLLLLSVASSYAANSSLLKSAAEQGDAGAQYNLGVMYAYGKSMPQDYAQAARWFRKAAEQGDVDAQFSLGVLYQDGKGVPQDSAEAARWFRKAAEQADRWAQYNLGVLYKDGRGVPQDSAEAARWYRKSAKQGYVLAQRNLGYMCFNGEGVPQDYSEAYVWSSLAATSGDNDAANLRDMIAEKLTPEDLCAAQKRAAKLLAEILVTDGINAAAVGQNTEELGE